ncbi:MAG: Heparinase family protein [Clostridia bacterium]|nr:Heparinase family protein [Clostridia bacterium]
MKNISLAKIREALHYGEIKGYTLFHEIRTVGSIKEAEQNPAAVQMIETLIKEAYQIKEKPVIRLPFRRFMDFLENGNRLKYENLFFESKNELHVLALAEVIERKGDFIEALEERLWSWCNEYSWELPAHVPLTIEEIEASGIEADEDIALFAAETAFYFAEILSLLKDKLHPLLVYRLQKEIDRRVLLSYEKRAFKWEDWQMNWSSVCAGSIGCAALYRMQDTNRLAKIIHRVLGSMSSYIEGFDKDGVTTEGLGYWQYGFSFYIYFAELLKERTCGRLDLLMWDDKIRKIAELPLYLQFPSRHTINFSDMPGNMWFGEYGLLGRLSEVFGIDQYLLPTPSHTSWDHTSKWALRARNIFWNLQQKNDEKYQPVTGCWYFEESQWLIDRSLDEKDRFCAFVAKGGHNDEPHNHNDLGNFILHRDGENIFCDLGAPQYEKDFFRERRYEFLHASSKGHSVPVINGHYQAAGKAHKAEVLQVNTDEIASIQMDLAKAYAVEGLTCYNRSLTWHTQSQQLDIKDEFEFEFGFECEFETRGNQVEEVFMTHLEVISPRPGELKLIGEQSVTVMRFDEKAQYEIETIYYKNHFSEDESVKRIKIVYADIKEKLTAKLSIKVTDV